MIDHNGLFDPAMGDDLIFYAWRKNFLALIHTFCVLRTDAEYSVF